MNQPIPTGPDLFGFAEAAYGKARVAGSDSENPNYGSAEEIYQFNAAAHHRGQALIAAIVMLTEVIATATGVDHYYLDGWREKIGVTWLKECRGKESRRPACEERHTDDCAYVDPPLEPRPKCRCGHDKADHDAKYNDPQCRRCTEDGERSWRHAYTPGSSEQEPTGPRIYVEHRLGGAQGHIISMVPLEGADADGTAVPEVQWYQPGAQPVREKMGNLLFITADHVERCTNGQTGDECAEIAPCEACQGLR